MCNISIKKNIIDLIFLLIFSSVSFAVDAKGLGDICQAMENAINDISIEYEWFHVPPMTIDDVKGTNDWAVTGWKHILVTKKPFTEHYIFSEQGTFTSEKGSFEGLKKTSYNGEVAKLYEIGGLPQNVKNAKLSESLNGNGRISRGNKFMIISTPIGFSVYRFLYGAEGRPLSELLREKDLVKVDDTPVKINDFNSIRADFFAAWNREVLVYKVYFAVDYGYTPIRYGYGPGNSLIIDINSLQEVQKGLWFPSSGFIKSSDPNDRINGFYAIDKIRVNRDLKNEVFDIEFPPGTRVSDQITGRLYTTKPTQEQVDKSLPK